MMSETSGKTALVFDHGLFVSLALRLAPDFKRVLYYTPQVETAFPCPYEACIGDGFSEIERVDDFWSVLEDVDLFIFPDVEHSRLQLHLEKLGKRVWGSRRGDQLELRRAWFRRKQKEWGLEVPPYQTVVGLNALRRYLESHEGHYVKISRLRALMETFCYRNVALGQTELDQLAEKLGPLQDDFPFVVEAPIEAVVETGWDGFCIDGQFPETACQSIEGKGRTCISTVTPADSMPPALLEINEALAPFMKQVRYRNWFSSEVRITEENIAYLTDPCCREASPVGECIMELIGNLAEIMWAGAEGELVEPEFTAKFAVQAMLETEGSKEHWRMLEVPPEIQRWVKPKAACKVDGRLAFPPLPWMRSTVGSVVALGDTLEDAVDTLKEYVGKMDGQGLFAETAALADTLKAITEEEEAGQPFTDQPVPDPSIVLEGE